MKTYLTMQRVTLSGTYNIAYHTVTVIELAKLSKLLGKGVDAVLLPASDGAVDQQVHDHAMLPLTDKAPCQQTVRSDKRETNSCVPIFIF